MTLKRNTKPVSVQEAKSYAERLKSFLEGRKIDISRSLALEALAAAAGYRDWNTFHAMLNQEEPPNEDRLAIERAKINRAFNVAAGEELACIDSLVTLCGLPRWDSDADMWQMRAKSFVTHVVTLHFLSSAQQGRAPCMTDIRDLMSIQKFCETFTALVHSGKGTDLLDVRAFLDTIPGLSADNISGSEPFQTKTTEQWSFLAKQLSKPIGAVIDA